ncbi:MAG: VOC family protein [Desulfuromonadaceae bacterium]|jgi:catechol 2,3-dioxygenase-like lactoylglutathione lyase family enzyme
MNLTLTLGVNDLERTASFYGELLQLPLERFVPADGHQPLLLLRRGDASILFRELDNLAALHPALFQNLDRHPLGVGLTLEFRISDLGPIRRAIDRQQRHLLYDLEDDEFKRSEIWLHDPDGYLVILCQEGGG